MQGRPMLSAPISRPGVVLSQPPISTAPSTGWLRISSSVSIASRLRYSIVVGLPIGSDQPGARKRVRLGSPTLREPAPQADRQGAHITTPSLIQPRPTTSAIAAWLVVI